MLPRGRNTDNQSDGIFVVHMVDSLFHYFNLTLVFSDKGHEMAVRGLQLFNIVFWSLDTCQLESKAIWATRWSLCLEYLAELCFNFASRHCLLVDDLGLTWDFYGHQAGSFQVDDNAIVLFVLVLKRDLPLSSNVRARVFVPITIRIQYLWKFRIELIPWDLSHVVLLEIYSVRTVNFVVINLRKDEISSQRPNHS